MTSSQTPNAHPADDPEVPAALHRLAEHDRALDGLSQRPLAEHADLYAQVHTDLQAALADIDTP